MNYDKFIQEQNELSYNKLRTLLLECDDLLKNVELMQKHSQLYNNLFSLKAEILKALNGLFGENFDINNSEYFLDFKIRFEALEEAYYEKDFKLKNYSTYYLIKKQQNLKAFNDISNLRQNAQNFEQNIQFQNLNFKKKNKVVALLLCFFLGFLGAHKFYEGKIFLGILYFFTYGFLFFGVIYDFVVLLAKPNPYYLAR